MSLLSKEPYTRRVKANCLAKEARTNSRRLCIYVCLFCQKSPIHVGSKQIASQKRRALTLAVCAYMYGFLFSKASYICAHFWHSILHVCRWLSAPLWRYFQKSCIHIRLFFQKSPISVGLCCQKCPCICTLLTQHSPCLTVYSIWTLLSKELYVCRSLLSKEPYPYGSLSSKEPYVFVKRGSRNFHSMYTYTYNIDTIKIWNGTCMCESRYMFIHTYIYIYICMYIYIYV